eukprot:5727604-Pleurochrysis_carterae.AAC.1
MTRPGIRERGIRGQPAWSEGRTRCRRLAWMCKCPARDARRAAGAHTTTRPPRGQRTCDASAAPRGQRAHLGHAGSTRGCRQPSYLRCRTCLCKQSSENAVGG